MRYQFIDEPQKAWPVTIMRGILDVFRSGYDDWTVRGQNQHVRANLST